MANQNSEPLRTESTSEYMFTSSVPEPRLHMLLKPKTPPKYSGQRNYNTIETWISAVNSYLFLAQARPPYIYHALITLLDGEAAIWFRYHFPESCANTLTWETVRDSLRTYFTPANKLQRLEDEWFTIHQVTSVPEYTARFSSLAMELASNGQQIPDAMLIHNYIRGLKPRTRLELQLKDPKSLAEAIQLADRFDQIAFSRFNKTDRYEQTGKSLFILQNEASGEPMQIDALHSKSFDKQPKLGKLTVEERTHLRSIKACFRCRQPGHMANECPTNSRSLSPNSKNMNRQ
jgi:hypothetical protein